MTTLGKVVELTKRIGYARALPGALNFLGLFFAIKLLGDQNYGVFSIAFGTVSIAIQVFFGLLIHGVVPLLSLDIPRSSIRTLSLRYTFITSTVLCVVAGFVFLFIRIII